MSDTQEAKVLLERYLIARIPLITIRTDERSRAIDLLAETADDLAITILCHTKSKGLYDLTTLSQISDESSVLGAMEFMRDQMHTRTQQTFVLTEAGDVTDETSDAQELLDLVETAMEVSTSIVLISNKDVWDQLQRMGLSVTLDKPNEEEAYEIISQLIDQYRGTIPIEWDESDLREAASAMAGITRVEIENTIASLIAKRSITKQDLVALRDSKSNLFNNINGLEKIETRPQDGEVGGLAALQQWCDEKGALLAPEKRAQLEAMGLRPPRGILLVGVPGCGKSLSAKAIAARWQLPLFKLDFATVQGQYVGQSEQQLKNALTMAEAVSPCVLWIDEIEKGLAGAGTDSTGVTTKMVGQFLFWLQECRKQVFVIATANNVSMLPAELLRRGRFDEIFFVDLPTPEERRTILALYMRKYLGLDFVGPFADELVDLTDGYSGADLESTVRDLAYKHVADPTATLDADYIRRCFENVVPLSQSSPEQIDAIRAWGKERAVPASGKPIGTDMLPKKAAQRTREVLL